jgi:hypothetical protein
MVKPLGQAYSTLIRPEDTERALSTLNIELLPDEQRPRRARLYGSCPRCGDVLDQRRWLIVPLGAAELNEDQLEDLAAHMDELGVDNPHGDVEFDLVCDCRGQHEGRPEGRWGCGSAFRVRVVWP